MFSKHRKQNKLLRKMGLKKDQEGIMNRYLREGTGWEPHLANTKEFILQKANKCTDKTSAVVLGSGWWLDVPVAELCEMFDKVYFIDIVHPKQMKQKAKRYGNLQLLQADVTGGAIEAVNNVVEEFKKFKTIVPVNHITANTKGFGLPAGLEPSFVASVNLLNQLDILMVDYMKRFSLYTHNAIAQFRQNVQQIHIDTLPKGKSCLVTDYAEIQLDDMGKELATHQLVFAELPKPEKQWVWLFDTQKTYCPNRLVHFKVKAVAL